MIEEHWPHDNPYWREGEMKFAPTIDAIADRIEAEYIELPKDAVKGVFLDELDPGRGRMDMEIMPTCSFTCGEVEVPQ